MTGYDMDIDEQAVRDLLTRQIDLLRYERGVARDILARLQAMREEVEALARRRDLDTLTRRQTEKLLADIEAVLEHYYGTLSDGFVRQHREAADNEAAWLLLWLSAATGKPAKPLPEAGRQALREHLTVGGLTLSEIWAKQKAHLLGSLKAQIRTDAVSEKAADLSAVFQTAFNHARSASSTWINTLSNQAVYLLGQVNPLVKGYRHISVLDGHTGRVCAARHGLLWDKDKRPLGHVFPFRLPALHPHCRSRMVWWFGGEWDGISGDDWVKSRTLAQLQEQFGVGIGRMLHDGTIGLADAVRSGGLRPATLEEIQAA